MKNKNKKLLDINTLLIALLVVVMAAGLYFTLSVPTPKGPSAPELLNVQVTVLGSDCGDCWNVGTALEFLGQQTNLKITSTENVTLDAALEIAAQYNITRLPALVILGETQNLTIQNFEKHGDALVFGQAPAPYYDIASQEYRGKVTLTVLDEQTCPICFNMTDLVTRLEESGIAITNKKTIKPSSMEGKQLMGKYKIERLPSILLSKDALEYDVISQIWPSVGSEEPDGTLVLRTVYPPYVNVSTGNVHGQVTLTVLSDAKCTDCYNTSILSELFKSGLNMHIKEAAPIDISSTRGKLLIKKYNLSLVPTVIASKDALEYPVIYDVWNQLGTIEKDGTLVLRNIPVLEKALGMPVTYRNLTSGEVESSSVAPAQEAEISAPTVEE